MNNAARLAAVNDLHARFNEIPVSSGITPSTVAAMITDSLLGLSRSARWDMAVESWAAFVKDAPEGRWSWAYNQGSVYFGYAIDGLI